MPRKEDIRKKLVAQNPRWINTFETVIEAFLTEECDDDGENPSLYGRLNHAYKVNFNGKQANNAFPVGEKSKKQVSSPVAKDHKQKSLYSQRSNANKSNEWEETIKHDSDTKESKLGADGANAGEKVDEALLQHMEMRQEVEELLRGLEKPSLGTRLMLRLQDLCARTCCKYTPRIFFKKPISWYSATATLDAGSLLRENYLGITVGIAIGFISFLLFSAAFAHASGLATLSAGYLMMVTIFGIASSSDFRCILLITLPYLVASRTRWLLMMFATTLTATGPALNFMHNSGNFRNGIACVLGQVSANADLMRIITKAPLRIITKQLGGFIDSINERLHKAREVLKKLKEVIFIATKLLTQKSDWIRAMVEACGDEIAMKNQCLAFFNTLYFNCAASMPSLSFLCNMVRMFAAQACNGVAKLNDICIRESSRLHSEMSDVAPVSEDQLEEGEDAILRFLGKENISVEIEEDLMDVNFDKNITSQVAVTMMIEERMDLMMSGLNYFKNIMAWVLIIWTLFTVIQLILQAALYRRNWLLKPFFDNSNITSQFVAQERRALENCRPAVLPLSFSERTNYVSLRALRWSKTERASAAGSLVFLLTGMMALIFIIMADYAMYQVVFTTAPAFSAGFGEVQQALEDGVSDQMSDFGLGPSEQTVPEIRGNSSMSEIGRSFLELANPLKDVAFSIDASICRPRPSEPDHERTILIGCALALTLLSVVVQIYVLRLRHLILAWYYPDGANRRAAWLRTYIRNTRGLFHRLIHKIRKGNLKTRDDKFSHSRLKLFDRFIFTHPILARYLSLLGIKRVFCANCAAAGNPKKKVQFQQDFTQCPQCGEYYCKVCQTDLRGVCMYCNVPLNTLAVEVDFEKWSSDEEYDYFYAKYFSRRKHEEFLVPINTLGLEETLPPAGFEVKKSSMVKSRSSVEEMKALVKQQKVDHVEKNVMVAQSPTPTSQAKQKRPSATRQRRQKKRTKWEVMANEKNPDFDREVVVEVRDRYVQTSFVRLSALDSGSFIEWRDDLENIGPFRLNMDGDKSLCPLSPTVDEISFSKISTLSSMSSDEQSSSALFNSGPSFCHLLSNPSPSRSLQSWNVNPENSLAIHTDKDYQRVEFFGIDSLSSLDDSITLEAKDRTLRTEESNKHSSRFENVDYVKKKSISDSEMINSSSISQRSTSLHSSLTSEMTETVENREKPTPNLSNSYSIMQSSNPPLGFDEIDLHDPHTLSGLRSPDTNLELLVRGDDSDGDHLKSMKSRDSDGLLTHGESDDHLGRRNMGATSQFPLSKRRKRQSRSKMRVEVNGNNTVGQSDVVEVDSYKKVAEEFPNMQDLFQFTFTEGKTKGIKETKYRRNIDSSHQSGSSREPIGSFECPGRDNVTKSSKHTKIRLFSNQNAKATLQLSRGAMKSTSNLSSRARLNPISEAKSPHSLQGKEQSTSDSKSTKSNSQMSQNATKTVSDFSTMNLSKAHLTPNEKARSEARSYGVTSKAKSNGSVTFQSCLTGRRKVTGKRSKLNGKLGCDSCFVGDCKRPLIGSQIARKKGYKQAESPAPSIDEQGNFEEKDSPPSKNLSGPEGRKKNRSRPIVTDMSSSRSDKLNALDSVSLARIITEPQRSTTTKKYLKDSTTLLQTNSGSLTPISIFSGEHFSCSPKEGHPHRWTDEVDNTTPYISKDMLKGTLKSLEDKEKKVLVVPSEIATSVSMIRKQEHFNATKVNLEMKMDSKIIISRDGDESENELHSVPETRHGTSKYISPSARHLTSEGKRNPRGRSSEMKVNYPDKPPPVRVSPRPIPVTEAIQTSKTKKNLEKDKEKENEVNEVVSLLESTRLDKIVVTQIIQRVQENPVISSDTNISTTGSGVNQTRTLSVSDTFNNVDDRLQITSTEVTRPELNSIEDPVTVEGNLSFSTRAIHELEEDFNANVSIPSLSKVKALETGETLLGTKEGESALCPVFHQVERENLPRFGPKPHLEQSAFDEKCPINDENTTTFKTAGFEEISQTDASRPYFSAEENTLTLTNRDSVLTNAGPGAFFLDGMDESIVSGNLDTGESFNRESSPRFDKADTK